MQQESGKGGLKIFRSGFTKLYIGFVLIAAAVFIGSLTGLFTAVKDRSMMERLDKQLNPYIQDLRNLETVLTHSKMFTTNWVFLQYSRRDKTELQHLHAVRWPALRSELKKHSEKIKKASFPDGFSDSDSLRIIFEKFDALIETEKEITKLLASFDDYQDPNRLLEAEALIEDQILPQSDLLLASAERLYEINKKRGQNLSEQVNDSLIYMMFSAPLVSALVLVVLLLSGFYIHFSVTLPVIQVKNRLLKLADGEIPEDKRISSRESVIRDMAKASYELKMRNADTAEFAHQIEKGNFDARLSVSNPDDRMANALISMQAGLKAYSSEMEQKVEERTREIREKELDLKNAYNELQISEEEVRQYAEELLAINNQLEEQNQKIDIQQRKILDSIRYALRIQMAILPDPTEIQSHLPESFLFFRPRDIVSGDFYFFRHIDSEGESRQIISVIDCTGHGVSGALMCMIGYASLSQILTEKQSVSPAQVLADLHIDIRRILKQESREVQDGMDMVLCIIFPEKKELFYAGAMNPLYVVRDRELLTIKGDKRPIGGLQKEEKREFTDHRLSFADAPLMVYLTTDGFQDQFGGPKDQKFLPKRFRKLLTETALLPISEQSVLLETSFDQWKGKSFQVDDVLVIGLHLS